ncbi:hypothetical protein AwDysgo_17580 [Bacteroidales bacterium]|nr:hypothetical protein AwDysgo_17580 [Bacteroidales bacterium]
MNGDIDKKIEDFREDITFSKTIRAGKRIYYLDVKKNRNEELFLSITESKKIGNNYSLGSENNTHRFEKHKIFLFKEDFDSFLCAFEETIQFIKDNNKVSFVPTIQALEPELVDLNEDDNEDNNEDDFDIEEQFQIIDTEMQLKIDLE